MSLMAESHKPLETLGYRVEVPINIRRQKKVEKKISIMEVTGFERAGV